jgi:cobalt-zinc-cadmium efflux system protein
MSIVATIGLLANLAILYFLHQEHGINARSAFLHVVSDTVSSVAILFGAAAMAWRPDLAWIDPVLSMAIGALILWGSLRIVLEITDILMESVPAHIDVGAVSTLMGKCRGVTAVHDLHVWTISSGMVALSAHLVVDQHGMSRTDEILTAVKAGLQRGFGIDHTTLQIESAEYAHVDDVHRH